MGEQVPRGFWAAAREEPDRVARHRRRRSARGPRASCSPAPTGSCTRCGPAACSRWRPGRDAHPQLGRAVPGAARGLPGAAGSTCRSTPTSPPPRSPTSSATRAPRRSSPTQRFADGRRARRPTTAGVPAAAVALSVGDIPGFTPLADVLADQPDTDARPTASPASSCSTRRAPPGDRRRCSATCRTFDPETWVAALQRQPDPLRHRARRRRGAPGDVADVPPVAAVVRLLLAALRAHRRADGAVGRRARAAARSSGTASPTSRWCRRSCTG